MKLHDFLIFTVAYLVTAFVDGFVAGFTHTTPASFAQLLTVAGVVTILFTRKERRA